MDVVFRINGTDYSTKLSTFQVENKVSYSRVVTTLDNVEHASPGFARPVLTVSFWPLSEAETADLYAALSGFVVTVEYSDPYYGGTVSRRMRLTSDLTAAFAMKSIDGNRYYKGGNIQLRGV